MKAVAEGEMDCRRDVFFAYAGQGSKTAVRICLWVYIVQSDLSQGASELSTAVLLNMRSPI